MLSQGQGRNRWSKPKLIWALFFVSAAVGVTLSTWIALAPLPLGGVRVEGEGRSLLVRLMIRQALQIRHKRSTAIRRFELRSWRISTGHRGREVLVGFNCSGARGGRLLALDDRAVSLDEYNTWKPTIYAGPDSGASCVMDVLTTTPGDGHKVIVVASRDSYWYASKLTVLEFERGKFHEKSEYWNPGYLYRLYAGDVDGDHTEEIVCSGENNDLKTTLALGRNVYVVFALDSANIAGQAPPCWVMLRPAASSGMLM